MATFLSDDETGPCGDINLHFRWDCRDIVDRPDRVEMTLWAERRWARGVTSDVTLRRLRDFKVKPGKACAWEYSAADTEKQSGEVTVGKEAVLTIPAVKITGKPGRLVVTGR